MIMKFHFDVRLLVHAILVAFAVASLGNVHAFFSTAGHPNEVAWALAIALGASLVTLSVMMTQLDRESDPQAFQWLLMTAVLLGFISGSLQMAVYRTHLPLVWAVLLGFGIPIGGEVLLSWATAAYMKARDRERFRNMSGSIESAVADHLENALASFDPELIRQHVERTINQLVRLAMDSVSAQAQGFYQINDSSMDAEGGFGPQHLWKAQERRAESLAERAEERKEGILAMLAEGALGTGDIADRLEIHRDTARKYCQELQDAGLVTQHRRQWQLAADRQSRKVQS
jgi:hypothetical protein